MQCVSTQTCAGRWSYTIQRGRMMKQVRRPVPHGSISWVQLLPPLLIICVWRCCQISNMRSYQYVFPKAIVWDYNKKCPMLRPEPVLKYILIIPWVNCFKDTEETTIIFGFWLQAWLSNYILDRVSEQKAARLKLDQWIGSSYICFCPPNTMPFQIS